MSKHHPASHRNMNIKDLSFDHSGLTMNSSINCNNAFTESVNMIFFGDSKKLINVGYYYGFSKGLLGMMSTLLMAMIGLKTGFILVRFKSNYERVNLWFAWATIFAIGGAIFAWISYPLQFNLWPITTIVTLSAITLYFFILLYTAVEILSFPKLLLKQTGTASIAIFAAHLLFSQSIPFNWNTQLTSHILYLMQNIWIVFLWTIIGYVLVKKNFEITL